MGDGMTYARLGRSGLLVSRIALGTIESPVHADESTGFAIMDAAIDAGVNYIDTADVYGGPQTPDMAKPGSTAGPCRCALIVAMGPSGGCGRVGAAGPPASPGPGRRDWGR